MRRPTGGTECLTGLAMWGRPRGLEGARPGPRGGDKCPTDWLPARDKARQVGPLTGKRPKLFKTDYTKKKKKATTRSKRRRP